MPGASVVVVVDAPVVVVVPAAVVVVPPLVVVVVPAAVVVVVPAPVVVVVPAAVVVVARVVVVRIVVVVSDGPIASQPAIAKPKTITETRNRDALIFFVIFFPLILHLSLKLSSPP